MEGDGAKGKGNICRGKFSGGGGILNWVLKVKNEEFILYIIWSIWVVWWG